jgi:hypothetical protein
MKNFKRLVFFLYWSGYIGNLHAQKCSWVETVGSTRGLDNYGLIEKIYNDLKNDHSKLNILLVVGDYSYGGKFAYLVTMDSMKSLQTVSYFTSDTMHFTRVISGIHVSPAIDTNNIVKFFIGASNTNVATHKSYLLVIADGA